jgi:outer membrane protein OmpA-like peptidoglycan-associated protein/tetratricopeptide (TPR) repeat protein
MIRLISFFLLFCFSLQVAAQDDESSKKLCNEALSKKALGLWEKGTDKKKYKKPERLEFLMKAIEMEPDFAEAHLAMGLELAARAKLENKPFSQTLPFFYKAIANCPAIHSEPYYYIGYEYYEKHRNDSAMKYLQKFLDFKSEDEKKFSKDWDAEIYQAKMMLKSAKKESQIKKNVQFDPSVVRGVSTDRDEYLAYISPDDKSCYYVRKLPVKSMNQVFASDKEREVFMISKRDKTGVFDTGQAMDAPFNTSDDNQGGCSISIDNKNLYFAMMRQEGGNQPNCDLYVCDNSSGLWSEMRKLSANVNHPVYWDSQPTIASDGLTLYFASDRPGGFGGVDLYFTRKDPRTGIWSVPMNLGPQINTGGDEKTPFIHSDSETLYFSSDGHFGFGGLDIFFVRKSEKGEWLDPENIGSPINGPGDDAGFFVSTDTKTGYFFSYEDEGKIKGRGVGRYDLYGFELYQEARPQAVALVKGTVKDNAGNQVSGAIVEIKDMKSKLSSFATVDSASGEYMIAVKKKNDVVITVKKEDIAFNTQIIRAAELPASMEPATVDLKVQEAQTGSSFVMENILYRTASADLQEESHVILENFAAYLKEHPKFDVEIQGHTDNVGNAKDNEALSSNRAFTVKALLETYGIEGKRITAKGYGQSAPLADNATEAGRAKNRRTAFVLK